MYRHKIAVLLSSVVLLAGCAAKNDGRFNLSGKVTVDGEPVPSGDLILEPDAGNKGPSSMARIEDGAYTLPEEQGIVGGKYTVTIVAFDGVAVGELVDGKALLREPYLEKVDFPKEDSTRDFDIKRKK